MCYLASFSEPEELQSNLELPVQTLFYPINFFFFFLLATIRFDSAIALWASFRILAPMLQAPTHPIWGEARQTLMGASNVLYGINVGVYVPYVDVIICAESTTHVLSLYVVHFSSSRKAVSKSSQNYLILNAYFRFRICHSMML